ncbi:metallophosphoesterase [Leptolyngbya cf. ectocarpi LEGE 11479]|uniref:Metallophosphoesterase n=1 Tax=Leptolyngbya cf. ectocarpi LEGE 11479 TaxID=1828722 RepID=A0A928X1M9_LEPEC|nr:metallophosphoesterase [Leptolyngbya ectocarpi]MBE9066797.1 metallophosphoesterase [Leptolyngbya cf. ectocarpi LEGE 11479]
MSDPILLAQVTDSHLLAQTTGELRGCNPWNSLRTVLQAVSQCSPNGLLLTGDLAEQGDSEAYGHLVDEIAPLGLPTYWLPGNHDCLPTLRQALQDLPRNQGLTSVDLGPWQMILLDSVLLHAKFGEGYLSSQELQQLQTYLQSQPHKPTLLALHHHPVPVGIDWVDQMQVQNADEFLTLVKQFSHVKLVVFGHIHHEFQQQFDSELSFYGCPSTYFQITSPETGVTETRSGFRLLWLYGDGSYRTEVRRIGEATKFVLNR